MSRVGSLGAAKDGDKHEATKIWWDVRPHLKFNTLEIRVTDMCTRIDEVVAIAAVIQALVAKLLQLRQNNLSWRQYRQHHIQENKWRAMRYGIHGKMIDFGKKEEVPMRFLALELLELIDDVVDDLGSRDEVEYIHTILKEGTSADRQIRVYYHALHNGATEKEALIAVVDHLVAETMENAH